MDSIKTKFQEIGLDLDWIDLAATRARGGFFLNTFIYLVQLNAGNCLIKLIKCYRLKNDYSPRNYFVV